jgi:hypothetical protein
MDLVHCYTLGRLQQATLRRWVPPPAVAAPARGAMCAAAACCVELSCGSRPVAAGCAPSVSDGDLNVHTGVQGQVGELAHEVCGEENRHPHAASDASGSPKCWAATRMHPGTSRPLGQVAIPREQERVQQTVTPPAMTSCRRRARCQAAWRCRCSPLRLPTVPSRPPWPFPQPLHSLPHRSSKLQPRHLHATQCQWLVRRSVPSSPGSNSPFTPQPQGSNSPPAGEYRSMSRLCTRIS